MMLAYWHSSVLGDNDGTLTTIGLIRSYGDLGLPISQDPSLGVASKEQTKG